MFSANHEVLGKNPLKIRAKIEKVDRYAKVIKHVISKFEGLADHTVYYEDIYPDNGVFMNAGVRGDILKRLGVQKVQTGLTLFMASATQASRSRRRTRKLSLTSAHSITWSYATR